MNEDMPVPDHSRDFTPPLVIGRNLALTSTPGRLPTVWNSEPDTVLDGANLDRLVIRGASIRGDSHRYDGEPRQDAMGIWQVDEFRVLACVADGVGSRPFSHAGSGEACASARRWAPKMLGDDEGPPGLTPEQLIVEIRDDLIDFAAHNGFAPEDLSTTLVIGLLDVRTRTCHLVALGDSTAMVLREGSWRPCFPSDQDDEVLANSGTHALPMKSTPMPVRSTCLTLQQGDMVTLCTDGLANPMRDPEVAETLADWWSRRPLPDLAEFLWQMSFRKRSHSDDRTAICIWATDPEEG